MRENPFSSGSYTRNDGQVVPTQHMAVVDRVERVKKFDQEQCADALRVPHLQKTVVKAIAARVRELKAKEAEK